MISEAGNVLEFLLFGGSLHLLFRGGDVSGHLRTRLWVLAIVGPELAHHILTAQLVPRLTVQIVRAFMQEDRSITRGFLEIRAKDGIEWDLPLPEAWEITDVEANFVGRLGRSPPLVPFPPAPRWYPKTLSLMPVLAMLAGWAYVCSLPRLDPSAMMYKEH